MDFLVVLKQNNCFFFTTTTSTFKLSSWKCLVPVCQFPFCPEEFRDYSGNTQFHGKTFFSSCKGFALSVITYADPFSHIQLAATLHPALQIVQIAETWEVSSITPAVLLGENQ